MNEELLKSLTSLIDESLAELEVMKKSDRFSASEIKIEGPGTGIAGKDPQGSLGKEDDEEDEDEEDEDEGDEGEEKAEKADKEEDKKDDKKEDKKEDKKDDKKEDFAEMKKSIDAQSTLLKSYVDSKFASFETQLDKIAQMVSEIADSPVPSKGVSYKNIVPLKKSANGDMDLGGNESEALTKSQVVEKLFALKKSGTHVDSADIAGAELANGQQLVKIANKYNIK